MSKFAPGRPKRFRTAVYRHPAIPLGCKLMLIRMSEEMNANGIVSVPRDTLAAWLGVSPPRISEWVAVAKEAGFISTVRRGRPGVTAVYQLLTVGTESVPTWGPSEAQSKVRKTDKVEGTDSVPTEASA